MLSIPAVAGAQAANPIVVTARPGDDVDLDDAIVVNHAALVRAGAPDPLGAVARDVAGVSLSDAVGNAHAPNLVYRGFSASSLQGNAQGLAVYVDGVRFNQPFGDTVAFDLLPPSAIDSVTIKDVNPVYGLNALGGVVEIATRNGRSAPGVEIYGAGGGDGRYGEVRGGGEAGWSRGGWSGYVAFDAAHDGGWRAHSPSTLYTGLVDAGWDGARAGIHSKYLGALTDLSGNGPSPIQLLAADYRAVFTYPDRTRNRFDRISLHPWASLGDHGRIEASLYWQRLGQRTTNGDIADVAGCADAPGLLCLEDAPLVGSNGAAIADSPGAVPYGVLNRGQTSTRASGGLVQYVDKRALFGGENVAVLGVSHDRSTTRFDATTELARLAADRELVGPGPIIAQPDGAITPVSLRTATRYTGLFVAETLPLGPRLIAELELRYNDAQVRLDDLIGTALNGSHSYRRVNPGIELDFKATPGFTLRAGYAEANRAPTPAELACADPASPCSLTNFFVGDPDLRQVVARNWELGASGRTKGAWRLEWLVSAYRTTSHDDIQYLSSATLGRAYFQNVGRTRRQGVEASAVVARGAWTVRAGYAFTDATFRIPLVLNSPLNPAADANRQIAVRAGARLPGIPRHRLTLSLDNETGALAFGADLRAQSGQVLFGDEGNALAPTGAFATIDLHASVRLRRGVHLFVAVSNLLDRRYVTFATLAPTAQVALADAPGASDPRSESPGALRHWLAGLRARF